MPRASQGLLPVLCSTVGAVFFYTATAIASPDWGAWDEILAARVDDEGRVAYRSLASFDREDLAGVLAALARVEPNELDRDDTIAFWLNAYHALVVLGVLQGYDPSRVDDRARLYHWLEIEIAGARRTPDEIRETLSGFAATDPRIHLAVCNATRSAPALSPAAFRGDSLDAQLARAARRFVNDRTRNHLDVPGRRAEVSAIFRWYRPDFEHASGSILGFVARFVADPKVASILGRQEMALDFAAFDWRLNAAPGQHPAGE